MISDTFSISERQLLLILILLVLLVGGFAVWQQNQLESELIAQGAAYTASTTQLQQENQDLEAQLSSVREKVVSLNDELEDTEEDLEDERERNDELQDRVEEVTDSVGNLQNTVATEPELLKKYSRTFFLNENYRPENLAQIDDQYLADDESLTIDERIWPYLEDLLEDADDEGLDLLVTSAYRPFGEQAAINDRFNRTFGSGANQFSAQQGYSEHQLGTTIDFTTPEVNGQLTQDFASTEAYEWLQDNANEYGFILSYPEGNQFYIFEPWHWRFVGEELAQDLDDENASFYDWDQRRIDEYRGDMFD
jgi:D-alanyl-D-alanine carboxypeptidase